MRTATFRPRLESMDPRIVPSVVTVDDDRGQRKNAQFTSIQAAVDFASPGDQIRVFPGTYREQVRVAKSLTLESVKEREAVITPPAGGATGNGILVTVTGGARHVVVDGFWVKGTGTPAGNVYAGIGVGGGASATVRDNLVSDIAAPDAQDGLGILVQGADAVVAGNRVVRYQKAGVVVFGPGNVAVRDNTVVGAGKIGTVAQVGIQVGDGASGSVTGNTVSGNAFTGPVASGEAAGIVVFQAGPVLVRGNELSGNQIGIAAQQTTGGTLILGNEVSRSTQDGIRVEDSKNVVVFGNEVERSGRHGIAVTGASSNVLVARNEVERSVGFDLFDDTAAGSNVVFVGNEFHTRNRPTLR